MTRLAGAGSWRGRRRFDGFRLIRPLSWAVVLLLIGGGMYLHYRTALTTPAEQALRNGQRLLQSRRVLAIVAHPDDLEWYIGGTLRELVQRGADVQVIVASDGEKGPNKTDAADLPATRRQEQAAAGQVIGYSRIYSLGLPDRGVAKNPQFLPDVERIYREVKPDAVFAFDPSYPALPYLHPDHQPSAKAFLGFWDTLGAGRPPVYLFQTRRPDVAVNISSVIGVKEQALAQHRSQNGGSAGGMRRSSAGQGRRVGVQYAELFRMLR